MTVIDDMRGILAADATLMALLPGGIHDRPLDPDDPVTAGAWAVVNPATGVKRLWPAAVLLEPQEVAHPFGRNPERRLDVDLWPDLTFYAPAGDMATLEAADERAMALLHKTRMGLADIAATEFRAAPLRADELPGEIVTFFRRYRVQTVRHIAEV